MDTYTLNDILVNAIFQFVISSIRPNKRRCSVPLIMIRDPGCCYLLVLSKTTNTSGRLESQRQDMACYLDFPNLLSALVL